MWRVSTLTVTGTRSSTCQIPSGLLATQEPGGLGGTDPTLGNFLAHALHMQVARMQLYLPRTKLTIPSPCSVGCCPGVQHLLCSSVLCLLCNFMFIAHCSTPLHSAPCASATACRTCWFSEAYVGEAADNGHVHQHGAHDSPAHVPRTTLLNLERTIQQRREAMLAKTGALGWLLPCLSSHPFHQGTAAQGLVKGA